MDHVTVFRQYTSSMGFSIRYGKKVPNPWVSGSIPPDPKEVGFTRPVKQQGRVRMFKIKPETGSGFNETRPELGLEPNLDPIKTKITKKPYIYIYINFKPYPSPSHFTQPPHPISLTHLSHSHLVSLTLTLCHCRPLLNLTTALHHSFLSHSFLFLKTPTNFQFFLLTLSIQIQKKIPNPQS